MPSTLLSSADNFSFPCKRCSFQCSFLSAILSPSWIYFLNYNQTISIHKPLSGNDIINYRKDVLLWNLWFLIKFQKKIDRISKCRSRIRYRVIPISPWRTLSCIGCRCDRHVGISKCAAFSGSITPCSLDSFSVRWCRTPSYKRYAKRSIILTNSHGIHDHAVADHTLALLLSLVRCLPVMIRQQDQKFGNGRKRIPFTKRLLPSSVMAASEKQSPNG